MPVSDIEEVETNMFAAGAGRCPGPGRDTECAWKRLGTGQIRPGANPHLGQVGALEKVEEARVETLCIGEECARKVAEALKKPVSLVILVPYLVPGVIHCN